MLPLDTWYRKELEQQLELGCTFTPKHKTTLFVRKLERTGFDPTSLAADGSNRPSSSRPGSSSSRKRRRVTLTLPDDNVSAQEEFVSEAPVVPAYPLWRRMNARARTIVQFEQVQDSIQVYVPNFGGVAGSEDFASATLPTTPLDFQDNF